MTTERVPLPGEPLTSREREVLGLMADGLTNSRIAARLSVSEFTVRSHVSRIMRKLGVAGRATGRLEAVIAAYRVGELRGGFVEPAPEPVVVSQPGFDALVAVAEGLLAGRPLPSVRREALVALTAAGRRSPGGRPLPQGSGRAVEGRSAVGSPRGGRESSAPSCSPRSALPGAVPDRANPAGPAEPLAASQTQNAPASRPAPVSVALRPSAGAIPSRPSGADAPQPTNGAPA